MEKYRNKDLLKILISLLLLGIALIWKINPYKSVLLVVSYIIISYEMYIEACKNIKEGEIFDENFLMIIATLGAIAIGSLEEAVLVMLLFQIGEYLSDLAVEKSEESITKLMDLKVETVRIIDREEEIEKSIEEVKKGDIFRLHPGEKVPLDGVIVKGESFLDTFSITGESTPKKGREKDIVLSGYINRDRVLEVKATSTYKTSTAQIIIDLVENASEEKSNTETFIRKFSKIYTPVVCFIALLLVIVPFLFGGDFHEWLYRALVFLVTSCPCALVISVPLGYFCGIGKASKEGIIVKGAKELETLTDIDSIFLDKTGTITEGVFEVTEINTKLKEETFLRIIASMEQNSIHPIAKAIEKKYNKSLDKVEDYQEIPGQGLKGKIKNQEILVGNAKLLKEENIDLEEIDTIGTILYLAVDKKYQGYLVISDKIKESSKNLKALQEKMKKEIIILSGDNEKATKEVAKEVGIRLSYGSLLPEEKVKIVKEYQEKGKTIFVGDGINDAPVLKTADIGISMGAIGSDAAMEASDIVLMNDDLRKIDTVIQIANTTKKKVTQSITFALLVKFIVLFLGVLGKSTILLAVFADVGVTLLVILYVLTIFFQKIN